MESPRCSPRRCQSIGSWVVLYHWSPTSRCTQHLSMALLRVVLLEDKVIDPNVPMDSSYGYPTPSFVEGLIIQTDSKSRMCFKTGVTTRPASRMVAWLGGKNMGSVTSHGFTHPTMERSPFKLIGWRPISGVPAPGGHFPTETSRRFGGESCVPA